MAQKNLSPNINGPNKYSNPNRASSHKWYFLGPEENQNTEKENPYPYPNLNSENNCPKPRPNSENRSIYLNPPIPQFGNVPKHELIEPSCPPYISMFPPTSSQPMALQQEIPPCMELPKNSYNNKLKEADITPSTPRPSLVIRMVISPKTDADSLNKAYTVYRCDKEAIRNIIARRSSAHRELILQEYQSLFGKSLIYLTKSKLAKPFQRVILSLLWVGSDLDAFMINKASGGNIIDASVYRDIICTRSSQRLEQLKESYQNICQISLVDAIKSSTSDIFQNILLFILNNPRDQSSTVNYELAKSDSDEFLSTKNFRTTVPSSFISIFAKRSNIQLLETFKIYHEKSGITVNNYLKKFIESDYQKCLITIHDFIVNPIRYYSSQLKEGLEKQLLEQIIRIVTTRCEIDLLTIIEDYNSKYKGNFADDFQKVFINDAGIDTIETILILIGAK